MPRLDIPRTRFMGNQLSSILSLSMKNIFPYLSAATSTIEKAIEALGQANDIVSEPLARMKETAAFADRISDAARAFGVAPAEMDQLLTTLQKGGADFAKTLKLLEQYAGNLEDIKPGDKILKMFLEELKNLGDLESNDRLKRIREVFGSDSIIDAQDAVNARKVWDKHEAPLNLRMIMAELAQH